MKRPLAILSALTILAACSTMKYLPIACPHCQRTYFNTWTRIEGTNIIRDFRCMPCKWVWSCTNSLPK